MKLFKFRKIFAIVCVIVLLFTFFSIPASCFSTVTDENGVEYNIQHGVREDYVLSPVPLTFNWAGEVTAPSDDYYGTYTSYLYGSNSVLPVFSFSSIPDVEPGSNPSEGGYIIDGIQTSYVDFYDRWINNNNSYLERMEDLGYTFFYDKGRNLNLEVYDYYAFDVIGSGDFRFYDGFWYGEISHEYNLDYLSLNLHDFYVWDTYFDDRILDYNSEVSLTFYNTASTGYTNTVVPDHVRIYYSYYGEDEVIRFDYDVPDDEYDDDDFELDFSPSMLGLDSGVDYLLYIHSCEIFYDISEIFVNPYFEFDVSYCFNPYLDNFDGFDYDNPAFNLAPYTSWLGTAASGFLDIQIFKGFTLGGIFMTLVAFTCCVWFLKLVAGG